MKVYAYKLSMDTDYSMFISILEQISSMPLQQRLKDLPFGVQIRIETINKDENGYWFINFVKFRDKCGPGKAHPERETRGFEFGENECFGEDTAVVYNSNTNYFTIQYNHNGPRQNNICEYFNLFLHYNNNSCEFLPKLALESERRFRNKSYLTKIEFSIAGKAMDSLDRKNGISLNKALEFGRDLGGDKINISIIASRGNKAGLSLSDAYQTIFSLRDLINIDEKNVTKLEVSGKDKKGDQTELIDFIGSRLCLEYDIIPDQQLRLPISSRYDCLLSAHKEWKSILV